MPVITETELNSLAVLKDRNFLVRYTRQKSAGSMPRYHYNLAHYEIIFLVEGIMRCCIGSRAFVLNADEKTGYLAVMDKGVSHHHSYNGSMPHGLFHIFIDDTWLAHFQAIAAMPLFARIRTTDVLRLQGDDRDALIQILKSMINDPPDALSGAVQSALMDLFFLRLLRAQTDVHPAEDITSTSRDILRVIRYIDEHYADPISLSTAAERFAFSKPYLSRFFHEETGLTFTDYLNQIRIKQAIRLLKDFRLSIQILSQQVGFQTPAYFSRVFKRQMGVTPQEYRRTAR
jgi:AraC-like DNA-binding protein